MREITAEEYTRFSSNESCHVGLSELEAMSLLAGPRLRARDGQTGSKCVGPGRLDQKLRTYDSLFPALMHGNLIVVTYPGCGYCFAGSPTRIPTARNIEGAPVPNRDDEHLGARIHEVLNTNDTQDPPTGCDSPSSVASGRNRENSVPPACPASGPTIMFGDRLAIRRA